MSENRLTSGNTPNGSPVNNLTHCTPGRGQRGAGHPRPTWSLQLTGCPARRPASRPWPGPGGQPCAPARAAAAAPQSAPFPAEPAAPAAAARQAAVAAAGAAAAPARAREGGRTARAGGAGSAAEQPTGARASRRQRPPRPRARPTRGAPRPAAWAHVRPASAGPWAAAGRARRAACRRWVASCAPSWGPGSTGLKRVVEKQLISKVLLITCGPLTWPNTRHILKCSLSGHASSGRQEDLEGARMTFHQLGESGTAFSLEDYAFVIENALSTFHSDSSFLLLSRTMRGSFSGLHHETPVGFLEFACTMREVLVGDLRGRSEAAAISEYCHLSSGSPLGMRQQMGL
ncbi:uncharacterized protein [Equus przewalskii]|uniref:Uncharacterized protein n=1 Tax=Equus przewalskii TaxID=9798 RepID=A0ABM4KWD3_EQUPR